MAHRYSPADVRSLTASLAVAAALTGVKSDRWALVQGSVVDGFLYKIIDDADGSTVAHLAKGPSESARMIGAMLTAYWKVRSAQVAAHYEAVLSGRA